MAFWLMKSEPDVYSIDDLKRDRRESWEGVRNYQVRNMMRDEMRKGDSAFFYHSNCKEPGIVGIMTIARESYPDDTQFDPESKYYDSKSDPGEHFPWALVEAAASGDLDLQGIADIDWAGVLGVHTGDR